MNESPIFVRCYDLLQWLIPRTLDFPNGQYGHVCGLANEVGRLLGGWRRSATDKADSAACAAVL